LECFYEKHGDVLYLTDRIDENMFQQIRDFKIDGEDDDLVKMKGANVLRVVISKHLGSHPANVSSSEFGHSASMERVICA
jgi:HSP90 family molecular chaperone